ncbi:uncharacterized protein G2W53_009017 [Senna tora]|uniref:Uncharacterized protein n=1 Tax=Senna tora TaxID=362788 RepID=A0A834WX06_9FABA|nr:uncharacterized protein G2W53_009017 [Senna tora]
MKVGKGQKVEEALPQVSETAKEVANFPITSTTLPYSSLLLAHKEPIPWGDYWVLVEQRGGEMGEYSVAFLREIESDIE